MHKCLMDILAHLSVTKRSILVFDGKTINTPAADNILVVETGAINLTPRFTFLALLQEFLLLVSVRTGNDITHRKVSKLITSLTSVLVTGTCHVTTAYWIANAEVKVANPGATIHESDARLAWLYGSLLLTADTHFKNGVNLNGILFNETVLLHIMECFNVAQGVNKYKLTTPFIDNINYELPSESLSKSMELKIVTPFKGKYVSVLTNEIKVIQAARI